MVEGQVKFSAVSNNDRRGRFKACELLLVKLSFRYVRFIATAALADIMFDEDNNKILAKDLQQILRKFAISKQIGQYWDLAVALPIYLSYW